MVRVTISLKAAPPEDFRKLFPNLTARNHADSTTLTGQLLDMHELQVVLKTLDKLDIQVGLVRSVAVR